MKIHNLTKLLFDSWKDEEGSVSSNKEIFEWINHLNKTTKVDIQRIKLSESDFWFLDSNGVIKNKNNGFFSIIGIQELSNGNVVAEQPIIIQNEIGYLGIISKVVNGKIHFLMQAKIEPGNINKIQLSPTIQATKSNFMQKHGGKQPKYLKYFINAKPETIIVDQIQSEQSSRFLKKRNRNIIICIDEEIEEYSNFKWMTLGQIKWLMKHDNIVNMDTRTVLSCLPIYNLVSSLKREELISSLSDKSMAKSIFNSEEVDLTGPFHAINNYKMFEEKTYKLISINDLKSWSFNDFELTSNNADFKVIFCDIAIEGREVERWSQPLFAAKGIALFGMITKVINHKRMFLVRLKHEIGCFDNVELGPTIQKEFNELEGKKYNKIEQLFFRKLEEKQKILYDVLLSEEGGRFYHEQNRNIIIDIEEELTLTEDYLWLDYRTINHLIQFNNVCNIQLRNLVSLLEVK